MDTKDSVSTPPRPLQVYRNWLANRKGLPSRWTNEYLLYTDSWVTGSPVEHGPYLILPIITAAQPRDLRPAIVLRVEFHLPHEVESLARDNPADDFAALFSLCHRMRLRAGSISRWFPLDDPKGRPLAFAVRGEPVLMGSATRQPVLPDLAGSERRNAPSEVLDAFPILASEQAAAVLRAAHLYRDAIWLADGEPEFSWLMLVSAIEAAAKLWALGLRPAKRFTTFIETFTPGPPAVRPDQPFRYPWDAENLRWSLHQIYDWRSRALHEGEPFPESVCSAPSMGEEKPIGTEDKHPTKKDPMPMLLHTFEHIVRHALLTWWRSMAPPPAHPRAQADAT